MICLIRKKEVPATPEEKVRQACLNWMVQTLGYPKGGIVVEKNLAQIPSLIHRNIPFSGPFLEPFLGRRLDILVTSQGDPLLVIECKALKIDDQALHQLLGYHHWLGTPFAALAGQDGIKTLFYQGNTPLFKEGLPHYKELKNHDPRRHNQRD